MTEDFILNHFCKHARFMHFAFLVCRNIWRRPSCLIYILQCCCYVFHSRVSVPVSPCSLLCPFSFAFSLLFFYTPAGFASNVSPLLLFPSFNVSSIEWGREVCTCHFFSFLPSIDYVALKPCWFIISYRPVHIQFL